MTKETENGHDFFLTQGKLPHHREKKHVSIFSKGNSISWHKYISLAFKILFQLYSVAGSSGNTHVH